MKMQQWKIIDKALNTREALKEAENSQIIVTAKFDNQYFSVDDNDETRASISLGYVTFNTGKKPIITNLEPSDSDKLVDLVVRDVEKKGDPAEKASVAFSVTRSFLKNFGGSDKDNLRMFTSSKDNAQFWSATMGSLMYQNCQQTSSLIFLKKWLIKS